VKSYITIITTIILTFQAGWIHLHAAPIHDHHPQHVLLKFAGSSELFEAVTYQLQSAGSLSIQSDDPITSGEIQKFMRESHIARLQSLTPHDFTETTAQGLERIFLAIITDEHAIEDVLSILHRRPDIEYAEPDYIGYGGGAICSDEELNIANAKDTFPNDSYFPNQWGLQNSGQLIGGFSGLRSADINILDGWDITTGSPDIIMAVLDSGIPRNHPEFAGRLVTGYDFVNNDADPEDDHGHGTSVTSIAAATGNNNGIMAGVDWNVKIMPVKILNQNNSGLYSWWINGVRFAVDNGAHVINMSVGGSGFSQPLKDAVDYALDNGVIVVACMMNENNDVTFYPAGYEGVISVGAYNNRDVRAVPFCWGGGSNHGNHIDFAAPGERIVSLSFHNLNGAGFWCGTSQAAPMVAGTITLMLSINPGLKRDEIYDILKETTRNQVHPPVKAVQNWDHYYGWGRIDAYAALEEVRRITTVSEHAAADVPDVYYLSQNYPNPFNPSTTIDYTLAEPGHVRITIYSILGAKIGTIVDDYHQSGTYSVTFDAANLPGGVYLYSMQTDHFVQKRKMMYVK
jgi:thermitase